MTSSQKISVVIVGAAVVFLLVAAYGLLPGLVVIAGIAARMFLVGGVVAVARTGKPKHRNASNQPLPITGTLVDLARVFFFAV